MIENTGDMRITHRRSKHGFVRKKMKNFLKSFPKVFDEIQKGAICVMKTKKRKGRGPFVPTGVLNDPRRETEV